MPNHVDLSTFHNEWYRPGHLALRMLWYLLGSLVVNSALPSSKLRVYLLRMFGASVGRNVVIKPYVRIKYPWNLSIGDNVWIGESVWIDNLAKVAIGNNVCISQGALLLCGNHDFSKSSFDLLIGAISLEDGVWLGAKSIVCAGVTCHTHAVLTVGSVATKALEGYSICQGNPATKIKERCIL